MNIGWLRTRFSDSKFRSALVALAMYAIYVVLAANLQVSVRPESFTSPTTPDRLLLQETERVFGHADIEAIVIDGSNRSDPNVREAIKKLTRSLKQVPGVKSIVSPAHVFRDASWLPVLVWSSDRMAGRILLQIDESTSAYQQTSKAIDTVLAEFPQLNPLRLSAHHLYSNAALELRSRLWRAALAGGLALFVALLLVYGASSATFWTIVLCFGTTNLGLMPPVLSGTPTGILGALAPLYWLLIHSSLIHLLSKEHPAQAITLSKPRYWFLRSLPLLIVSFPILLLLPGAENAESKSFLQLSIVQLLAGIIPVLVGAVRSLKLQLTLEQRPCFATLGEKISPLVRRSLIAVSGALMLYLLFGEGVVKFDGISRSIFPAVGHNQQLLKTVRTIFPADKNISVILSRTDGNVLDQNDDAFIERIAERLRQHPDVFAVYSPGAITTFQNLDRSARVLAGGKNPFPWLLRSFYRSEDSKTSRLLIETSADGTALLRLQRELTDLVKAQLNLGAKGLEIEALRPTPPKFSGLPKDQMPADFGADEPVPLVSTPPPAISHLAAFVVSREISGETAFLANTDVLPNIGLLTWSFVCVLLLGIHRRFEPLISWSVAAAIVGLATYSEGTGLIVERMHSGTTLGLTLASVCSGLLLAELSLQVISAETVLAGLGLLVISCIGLMINTDSPLIGDFALAGSFYSGLALFVALSLWHELLALCEKLNPIISKRLAVVTSNFKRRKSASNEADTDEQSSDNG